MASVQFTLCRISPMRQHLLIPRSVFVATQTITSSASNQVTTIAANPTSLPALTATETAAGLRPKIDTTVEALVWRVATDGPVTVKFGTAPVATTTDGYRLPAAGVYMFEVSVTGEKGAVIN